MMRRNAALAAVFMVAALLACVFLRTVPSRLSLMSDDGLSATSIDMDHDAMLASNPTKNAAFQRIFRTYLGQSDNQVARETQLTQTPNSGMQAAKGGDSSLASNIQAQLTAGTKSMDNSGVVSPTFLAALEAVGTDPNEIASQSALSQRQTNANIYATPDAETKRQAKQDSAEEADDVFLAAAAHKTKSAKELVKQAALAQMQKMSQPAPTQELAQPSGPMQAYVYPGKAPYGAVPVQYAARPGQVQYAARPGQMQYAARPGQVQYAARPGQVLAYAPGYVTSDSYWGPEQAQSAMNNGQVPYSGPARLAGYQAPVSRAPAYATPQVAPQARQPRKYQSPQQAALAQMRQLGLDQ